MKPRTVVEDYDGFMTGLTGFGRKRWSRLQRHETVTIDAQDAPILLSNEAVMDSLAARRQLGYAALFVIFAMAVLWRVAGGNGRLFGESLEIHRARLTAAIVLVAIAVAIVVFTGLRRRRLAALFRRLR